MAHRGIAQIACWHQCLAGALAIDHFVPCDEICSQPWEMAAGILRKQRVANRPHHRLVFQVFADCHRKRFCRH